MISEEQMSSFVGNEFDMLSKHRVAIIFVAIFDFDKHLQCQYFQEHWIIIRRILSAGHANFPQNHMPT